ncbi:MAG TPA: hypothetical protein VF594_02080, partial [Rubricoccaceae bacterium]
MRAVRLSALVVPLVWGGLAAAVAGLAVGRAEGTGAGIGAAAAVLGLVVLVALRATLRRVRVARQRLPEAARAWLSAHVPLYAAADGPSQARFER